MPRLIIIPALIFSLFLGGALSCCYCKPPVIKLAYDPKIFDGGKTRTRFVKIQKTWIWPAIVKVPTELDNFLEYMTSRIDTIIQQASMRPEVYLSNSKRTLLHPYSSDSSPLTPQMNLDVFEHDPDSWAQLINLRGSLEEMVQKHNIEMTNLRDNLWDLLFRTERIPSKSDIRSFVARSATTLENLLPQMISTVGLSGMLREYVAGFLVPIAGIWHDCESDKVQCARAIQSTDFTEDLLILYIQQVAGMHRHLQDTIEDEERVRNPYGFGDTVIISVLEYHRSPSHWQTVINLLLKSTACRTSSELLQIDHQIIKHCWANREWPKRLTEFGGEMRILVKRKGRLRSLAVITIPCKSTGKCHYPSALLLRSEVEDCLLRHRVFPRQALKRYFPIVSRENTSVSSRNQQESLLLSMLGRDTIRYILRAVHEDGYESQVPLVCSHFRALSDPRHRFSLKRAKELTLFMVVPRKRVSEFIISAVATIRMHQYEYKEVEEAAKMLALILYHSYPHNKLFNAMRKRPCVPEHLQPWESQIDMIIFRLIASWLFQLTTKGESISRYRHPVSWQAADRLLNLGGPGF